VTAVTATRERLGETRRRRDLLGYALLGALSYVPLLLTAPGRVAADTKQYLYLDSSRLLSRAPSLWDPNVHLGTVTHQNIGYLFPMGPFFWFFDKIGSPDWVAQRLWLGSIVFAAGLGILFLLRTLGVRGPGVVAAALVYMLSPYTLQYASRLSILLVAWAALPWMVGLVARALREGGWRHVAIFAIVVQLAGSVNATVLVFVGIAPILWIVHAVWVAHEVSPRRALQTVGKIALLSVLTSLWWIMALSVQAGYGLDVLKYTETIKAVSTAGHSGEVLRGLGYWFFYGGDKLGPWIEAAIDYMQQRWLIAVGYAIPILALVSAAFLRWRHRVYFIALVVIGVVIAVGAHPYDDPSPFGALAKSFGEGSTVGLALRSVGRALPLVALGFAVLLGMGVNALAERLGRGGRPVLAFASCAVIGLLAIANLPPLWNGTFYGSNLQRDENIPSYWRTAIAALDAGSHDTRILELPGSDFANYRWGGTVEPITPGLTDRPYVARELIPYGSAASASLLAAFDRRLQLRVLAPDAVAPIARLMGVGDVVLRNDLEVERYDLVRPRETWQVFGATPPGLGAPTTYGGPAAQPPITDARELAIPAGTADPASIVVFPVKDPRTIVRIEDNQPVLIVAGDADGLIDLAQAGLLDGTETIRYAASFGGAAALDRAIHDGSGVLVVTDTNRRRAQRWDTVVDNVGYTERVGEKPLKTDTADTRLDVFPGAGDGAFTVAEQRGVQVSASAYGTRSSYLPADRPAHAFDGDPSTAWRVGAFAPVGGERIRADFDAPVATGQMNLVQPLSGPRDRYITKVTLQFSDAHGRAVGKPVTRELGPESRTAAGQTVDFPKRRFSRVEIVVAGDNVGAQATYPTQSAVGFAEIRVHDDTPGASDRHVDEVIRMPTDLTGPGVKISPQQRLVYEMTRLRTELAPPNISEEETALAREFSVPASRDFGLTGTARLSPSAPDDVIDRAVGLPDADAGGVTAASSERLRATVGTRASSAIDGDPATAWSTEVGTPTGQWIELGLPAPTTFDHLDLRLVADGRHSVPTRLRVEAGGETRIVDVPAVPDGATENAVATVPVRFAPLHGDRVKVTIDAVRPVTAIEYYANVPTTLPVAISELGLPGVQRAPLPSAMPLECRTDLLTIDGQPVSVQITGNPATGTLQVNRCGGDAAVNLSRGTHVLRATRGAVTGIDLDNLVLSSDVGNRPVVLAGSAAEQLAAPAAAAPRIRVVDPGRTKIEAEVTGAHDPFWLVLGQSFNNGWRAEVNGRDLGTPVLVDGMSNGWRVDPAGKSSLTVTLTWQPQRGIWIALAISALALVACVVLAIGRRRRRRDREGAAVVDEIPPVLESPFAQAGQPVSRRRVLVATGLTTALTAIMVTPWMGPLVGAATFVALVRPRLRWIVALGAPVALLATGSYVIVQQSRYLYPPVFEWPTFFDAVHVVGLLAVMLVAADAVCELARREPDARRLHDISA
jgi:arabinofuranan 3-O-arabinosyltransferase